MPHKLRLYYYQATLSPILTVLNSLKPRGKSKVPRGGDFDSSVIEVAQVVNRSNESGSN